MIKKGDIVKFNDGLYPDEEHYIVIEANGDRAIIEYICNLPIPPQYVAKVENLEVIE